MSGAEPSVPRLSRRQGRGSLEGQVRALKVPPVGEDGSYYLGEGVFESDEELVEFLAQHYEDRHEGIA
jgi:hypothetical protein